jgi:hypothetical protein
MTAFVAEFETPEAILRAARSARAEGFRDLDAYTPFPLAELDTVFEASTLSVRAAALIGGIAGGGLGFLMQAYSAVYDYPIDVGGRPPFSWPAFIPLTFELMVLGAALTGFFTFIIACGLPRYHHPVFDVPGFERASLDRFYLFIRDGDAGGAGDSDGSARSFLERQSPLRVSEVRP